MTTFQPPPYKNHRNHYLKMQHKQTQIFMQTNNIMYLKDLLHGLGSQTSRSIFDFESDLLSSSQILFATGVNRRIYSSL